MNQIQIEKIILTYEKKIQQFFLKNTFDQNDVDDLVQESICQIITSLHSFKGKSHISTWIYSVCRNVLFSYIYQKEKQKKIIKKIKNLGRDDCNNFENTVNLKFLIDSLSVQNKLLYKLFYIKKYSLKEIAGLLHKPSGTIKYYLYQLRNELKRHLE